ncbi:MAG: hypothetical protein AABZ60_08690 [Planctomycetota bacterium]
MFRWKWIAFYWLSCGCFFSTAQNLEPFSSKEFLARLEAPLVQRIRCDLRQRQLLETSHSPIKANRPIRLRDDLWQCPLSHDPLKIFHFLDILPSQQVDVYYSVNLHGYWTRVLGTDGQEIWNGRFQFGFAEEPENLSPEDRPGMKEVERFIQNVMLDEKEGGTGFFENQFAGIQALGPKTVFRLDTLIRDHLQDEEFQSLCCRAIGELRDLQAIPFLKNYLNDAFIHEGVKQEAVYTLAELGDRGIIDQLIHNYQNALKHPQMAPIQKIALYTQLATIYYRLKEFDKSIECYQCCIQINATDITYYNLACMYAKLGQVDKAIENLGLSIQKGYDQVAWMKKDGDLNGLREDPRFIEMIQTLEAKQKKEEQQ